MRERLTPVPTITAEPNPLPAILPENEWLCRRAAYQHRIHSLIQEHQKRMAAGRKHPVYDFLFTYYQYRPGQLLRWHPGLGVSLLGRAADEYLGYPCYEKTGNGVSASPRLWKPQRREGVAWMLQVLEGSATRPPFFGCYGFHEWAMVYRTPEIRHAAWPLRYPPETIAEIVESHTICCSHFDAFRFFTEAARPLNRLQLDKQSMPLLEQRGCLHNNMDLYKWAYKLTPFVPSGLIADAFALAWDVREIDMRASPYDLRALGFEPIPVETAEGRAEYERHQRAFAERGMPIRSQLIAICRALLKAWQSESSLL